MIAQLPSLLLRLEGLVVLAAALALYFDSGFGWLLLIVLFLAPDVSMLGYVEGPAAGAAVYDVVHTYRSRSRSASWVCSATPTRRCSSRSSGSPTSAPTACSGTGSSTRPASATRTSSACSRGIRAGQPLQKELEGLEGS